MPIGILINSAAIITGGLLGQFLSHYFSENLKTQLNMLMGLCSIGMGLPSIAKMANMSAVILALILGTILGLGLRFGTGIQKGAAWLAHFFTGGSSGMSETEFSASFVTVLILFCASGTGIYGSLESGMTGEHSLLISKSILDFFTAAIFSASLGRIVSLIALPQFAIFFSLFLLAGAIVPLTTSEMIADFRACGGFLMLATGFRILGLKMFPTADMIPAMILVIPLSGFWTSLVLPLLTAS